jgi:hypothetical protein
MSCYSERSVMTFKTQRGLRILNSRIGGIIGAAVICLWRANVVWFFDHDFSEILEFHRQEPMKSEKSLKIRFKEPTDIYPAGVNNGRPYNAPIAGIKGW